MDTSVWRIKITFAVWVVMNSMPFSNPAYMPLLITQCLLLLQVPIMYTVYLNSSFQKFGRLVPGSEALQDGFFDLPPGYHPKTMEEVIQKRQLRAQEAAEMDLQHGSESPLQLDLTEAEMRALES